MKRRRRIAKTQEQPGADEMKIPFVNGKGQTVLIPGEWTIADAVRAGVKEIRLLPRGKKPPNKHWFVHDPKTK